MSANTVRISLALGALVPALVAFVIPSERSEKPALRSVSAEGRNLKSSRSRSSLLTPIEVQPESKLWIAGTSTVRGFQCQAGAFDAKLGSAGSNTVSAVLAGEKAVSDIVVTVPAEKLDCRNSTMNEHMRKALKVEQFPTITFRVASYDLAKAADGVNVTLNGALTLGGVEKPITINATAKPGENGTLLVSGTREVRMTEFGLKPPTLMLGTMKVDERIKVGFDIVLKD